MTTVEAAIVDDLIEYCVGQYLRTPDKRKPVFIAEAISSMDEAQRQAILVRVTNSDRNQARQNRQPDENIDNALLRHIFSKLLLRAVLRQTAQITRNTVRTTNYRIFITSPTRFSVMFNDSISNAVMDKRVPLLAHFSEDEEERANDTLGKLAFRILTAFQPFKQIRYVQWVEPSKLEVTLHVSHQMSLDAFHALADKALAGIKL